AAPRAGAGRTARRSPRSRRSPAPATARRHPLRTECGAASAARVSDLASVGLGGRAVHPRLDAERPATVASSRNRGGRGGTDARARSSRGTLLLEYAIRWARMRTPATAPAHTTTRRQRPRRNTSALSTVSTENELV